MESIKHRKLNVVSSQIFVCSVTISYTLLTEYAATHTNTDICTYVFTDMCSYLDGRSQLV